MPANPESILDSVKKTLGVGTDDTSFDLDIILYINMAFSSLQQLGAGPLTGFFVTDNTVLWSAFTSDKILIGWVKSYIVTKTRLLFDAPPTSFVITALEKQLDEITFRINIHADPGTTVTSPDFVPTWWNLTTLSDFPTEAVIGDFGYNTTTWDIFVNVTPVLDAFMWDLTGLNDFPSEAVVGDLGIDNASGDVWRKVA